MTQEAFIEKKNYAKWRMELNSQVPSTFFILVEAFSNKDHELHNE